jgi:hypothetical protein
MDQETRTRRLFFEDMVVNLSQTILILLNTFLMLRKIVKYVVYS